MAGTGVRAPSEGEKAGDRQPEEGDGNEDEIGHDLVKGSERHEQ
jgi:hypothetical protein